MGNMKASFWHQIWADGHIAFHHNKAHALLVEHLAKLQLANNSRVFLPLCGKTRDIAWLLSQGYQVVGAELSELAIIELFKELGITPHIAHETQFKRYHATNIDILVGNIFNIKPADIGQVNAIYDRAALVALPADMRALYSAHLIRLSKGAAQLLITFEYCQEQLDGPPFSIAEPELREHYATDYDIKRIVNKVVKGGLKGKVSAIETLWLLQRKLLSSAGNLVR
ncbi:MAG: thiopurine S-methyltransferase [Paraglaciecola sp.]|jgi:thiopurine S-methyltransferase